MYNLTEWHNSWQYSEKLHWKSVEIENTGTFSCMDLIKATKRTSEVCMAQVTRPTIPGQAPDEPGPFGGWPHQG